MTCGIDAECALAFWMKEEAELRSASKVKLSTTQRMLNIGDYPSWAYMPNGMIPLVTTKENERIRKAGFSNCFVKATIPAGSFVLTDDGLYVPSPEFCFLRLANKLSIPELAKAGGLLCSNFAYDDLGQRIDRVKPVTTVSKIRSYINKIENANGIKNARVALRFMAGGAASPPEIDTQLLLSLSVMRGGRGCPVPELNGRVRLNVKAMKSLGYSDCYCDLLWRDAKCAVEYTSEEHHSGYQKQVEDEIRRAALESMGYRVFFLTKSQLYSQAAFEGICRPILHALDRRSPKRTREYCHMEYELRKTILYEPSWIIRRACCK